MSASLCEFPGCNDAGIHNIVHPKTGLTLEACDKHRDHIINMITKQRKKKNIYIQQRLDDEEFPPNSLKSSNSQ